jgi:exodeoxyribonuclease III
MRIVIWNCAMSLHTKWDRLLNLRPDLAVIAECAKPSILWLKLKYKPVCDVQWVGDNQNKGLGVFAFRGFSLERDNNYDSNFKQFLPVYVTGKSRFSLLAVWSFNGRRKDAPRSSYSAETLSAIDYYKHFLGAHHSVIAGDFNNSVVWDHQSKTYNFSAIASRLKQVGLKSAYHDFKGVSFGVEPDQTLFFRKSALEYHIDYCFIPQFWNAKDVVVGRREQWIGISDHAPLLVDCIDNYEETV